MSDGGPASSHQRRVEELEWRLRSEELLDPALDEAALIGLALELALAAVQADVALILLRNERKSRGGTRAYARLRGEAHHRTLDATRSRLAHDTLRTGLFGIQADTTSPGALEAAELLGEAPKVRLAAPLRRGERVFGVLEVAYRVHPDTHLEDEQRTLRSVADHLAVALDAARLVRQERLRSAELAHLIDIGTKISAHVDLDQLLKAIVDAIQELVPADAVGIFLVDPDESMLRREMTRGYDHARAEDLNLDLDRGILGWVVREGRGIIVPDVTKHENYVGVRAETKSEIAAPLSYEGTVIGVFNLESDRRAAFDDHDLELLGTFSNQAAISIMHARLHADAKEKRRLEGQLEAARNIQATLLPSGSPDIPGHVLTGRNIPSSAVGGDYFDFLRIDERRWAITVADVSGNGISAGLIMAGFRAELRAELRHHDDPRAVFSHLNGVLVEELDPDHFVTAFLGVYTPESGTLVYSSAGHEPGLLLRSSGEVERLGEGGLLLGVFREATYGHAMVHLAPGDQLILYTDGLSDAGDPWGDRLGEEGVLRLHREVLARGTSIQDLPTEILIRALAEAVPLEEDADPARSAAGDFEGAREEADDRTLVVLARSPRAG